MTPKIRTISFATALVAAVVLAGIGATVSAQPAPYDERYSPVYQPYVRSTPPSTSHQGRSYQLPDRAAAYAGARTAYFNALDRQRDAQNQVGLVTRRLFSQQMSSPEVRETLEQLQQARRRYEQARQNAMQSVQGDPQFRQAKQRADRIDQTIERVRDQPGTTQREIVDLSQEQLDWAEVAGEYKTQAAETPEVRQARREMVDAYMRLQELEDQAMAQVRSSEEVRLAQSRVQQAESDWYNAREQLATTQAGYLEALDQRGIDRRDDDRGRYAPWMYGAVYDTGTGRGLIGTVRPGDPDMSIGVDGSGFSGQAPSFGGEVPGFGGTSPQIAPSR